MRISTRPAEPSVSGGGRHVESFVTPFGPGRITLAGDLPIEVELPLPNRGPQSALPGRGRWPRLLERYFAGEQVVFGLDVDAYADAAGLTAFARDVCAALLRVPHGEVVSYRELAHAAGYPHAYRAAGSVMARNRLSIILPCHRVVHNDGTLGRYGDDPAWKQRLLALEGVKVKGGRLG